MQQLADLTGLVPAKHVVTTSETTTERELPAKTLPSPFEFSCAAKPKKHTYHAARHAQTPKGGGNDRPPKKSENPELDREKARIAALMYRMGYARIEVIVDLVENHSIADLLQMLNR